MSALLLPVLSTTEERVQRARLILAYLKKTYPTPVTELTYETPFQLVAAVMLSAQCTDKKVNHVTDTLYKKYRTARDFANADFDMFVREISSITFPAAKAKNVIAAGKLVQDEFGGEIPKTLEELIRLPGVAYKSSHVILGELYNIWEGIPTDTHVRRLSLRFDLTSNTDLTKISKDLEALMPKEDWKYVNNGFVLYGRYVCPALPHACDEHPLTKIWPPAAERWPKAK
ncbi:endonuclease III [Patescibacteria group bacterium]|nr:endonuclease III [Patescibacteria group bacterium]